MILTLNITPEKSTELAEQARQAGVSLEEYVQQALEQITAPSAQASVPPGETGEQKGERFLHWAGSHDRTRPILPLETLDREHFYEERG